MSLPYPLRQNRPPSIHSRTSRASSVRSTRTGVSIATIQDDARSIDLQFGGQSFRITRDGSRILTDDPDYLPPYSTALPHVEEEDIDDDDSSTWTAYPGESTTESETEGPPLATSRTWTNVFTPTSSQGSDVAPERQRSRSDAPQRSLQSADGAGQRTLRKTMSFASLKDIYRNPSFTAGPDRITVDKRRTVSEGDVMTMNASSTANIPLKRRNRIRLPRLLIESRDPPNPNSGSSSLAVENNISPSSSRETQSAGPTFSSSVPQRQSDEGGQIPSSPTFIGRDAPGIFPPPKIVISRRESSATEEPGHLTPTATGYSLASPAQIEENFAESRTPPAMDSENDISIHYTRMIRSIDRDYRKALHERDTELADLRVRLNEKDTVYRQELRARDFLIDDMKSRLAHLEEEVSRKVEKARNEVEDLWETRWKDRDHHLVERMRRIETDGQKQVERAVAERDKEWAAEWTEKHGQLMNRLRSAEGRLDD